MDSDMNRNTYAAVSAVLGAVIGVLATLIVFTFVNREKTFDGDYNRWRKLNPVSYTHLTLPTTPGV